MIGFFIGTVCLVGLIGMIRRGRRMRHGWYGGHMGYGGWQGGPGFGGRGPRMFLRNLFVALGTSPSQEKVIVAAAEELRGTFSGMKDELGASRAAVAEALRGATFSGESMGEVFARHDDALRKVREAATGALARVHDVLDESQRQTLAGFIERGMRGGRGFGSPYRMPFAL